jgi:hypothetical protein
MNMFHIFAGHDPIDTEFATQLMTYLRDVGTEVMVNRIGTVGMVFCTNPAHTDLDDMTFGRFLSQELLRCQHLIVIQTPEALQSQRMRVIVETVLQQVEAGQMTGLLHVTAFPLSGTGAQEVPLRWATAPQFDASQDYPKVLARHCSRLGIVPNNVYDISPVPALPPSNPFHTSPPSHAQRPVEKKRPQRYPRIQFRRGSVLLPLVMLPILLFAGSTTLNHLDQSPQHRTGAIIPTPLFIDPCG